MQSNRLPLEVVQTILRLISKDSLAPASLVCKAWRSLILPRLYESIQLYRVWNEGKNQYVGRDELMKKILEDEANEHGPQLSSYIKHLRAQSQMDDERLELFGSAVTKMKNLERLDWEVSTLEGVEWYPTLVNLCQELPNLRSLGLTMAQNEISLGELDEVVELPSLRELSIKFDGLTGEEPDEELPNTLVEFIRGACNIEALRLEFVEDDEFGGAPWGSIDVFSALASDRFPNLRTLEVKSKHLVPIDNFSGPHIRQFLQNHDQLQKVVFLTGGYDDSVKLLNPPPLILTAANMEEMMPSIRHFGGPGLPIEVLLKSKLAKQVEVLTLHEPAAIELGDLSSLLPELDSPELPELSSLKGLGCFMNGDGLESDWEIIIAAISKLAIRIPVLQELILCPSADYSPEELDQLLPILEQLPHLRRLVIHVEVYRANKANRDDAIQRFYERAKALCPLLDTKDTSNTEFILTVQ